MFFRLFLCTFDPYIFNAFKKCFYWIYLHEYTLIYNFNRFNLSSNEKFMLKISTVGLSWEIENDYVMQVDLSKFDISYHGIFKNCFNWRYPY